MKRNKEQIGIVQKRRKGNAVLKRRKSTKGGRRGGREEALKRGPINPTSRITTYLAFRGDFFTDDY